MLSDGTGARTKPRTRGKEAAKGAPCTVMLRRTDRLRRGDAMKTSLIATLASEMRIQTIRMDPAPKTNSDFPDLGLRNALLGGETPFNEELPPIDHDEEQIRVWMVRDSFRCHYFLSPRAQGSRIWGLGPYITEDLNLTEINSLYEMLGLRDADMQFLSQYYHTLPRIRDENLLYTIVYQHCADCYGSGRFAISYWEMSFLNTPKVRNRENVRTEYQRDMVMYLYSKEKQLMGYIADGNLPGALSAAHKMENKGMDARTTSTMRS